jgi:hypothetical protein
MISVVGEVGYEVRSSTSELGMVAEAEVDMGWIDVAIPGVIGVLLAVNPQWFFKPSGEPEKDRRRTQMFRTIGFVLLAVAGIYSLVKFMMRT